MRGRVGIVTGAASGIGLAAVRRLLAEGVRVAALDLDLEGARAALAGGDGVALRCDVTDEAQVAATTAETVERLGGLDLLIACAGHPGPVTPLADVTAEEWDHVFAINAKGVFLSCKHAVRAMRGQGGGAIAVMASDSSYVASPGIGPYCASKGAVLMLVRALATDHGEEGIRINCVSPSIVDTPMPRLTLNAGDRPLSEFGVPAWHTADEIAGHLVYLCSDACRGLNGSSIVADFGGMARSSFPV